MQYSRPILSYVTNFTGWRAAAFVIFLLIGGFALPARAQMPFPPPNQLQVYNVMGLDFGSFYPSSANGTVTVSPEGNRTASGVTLIGGGIGTQAMFDVVLVPGRLVSMSWQATTILTNGPHSITLTIGPTDKTATSQTSAEFVTTSGSPFRNPVNFGGSLNVGNIATNPPGNYSGTFMVTFHQN